MHQILRNIGQYNVYSTELDNNLRIEDYSN